MTDATRARFEEAHMLTDLPLTWEGTRYQSDSTQRHWFTWLEAWQAALSAPAAASAAQPNYEAAYKAHEDGVLRMAGRHYPLNDEGKAMVRAIVNAALVGRATDTERGEGK